MTPPLLVSVVSSTRLSLPLGALAIGAAGVNIVFTAYLSHSGVRWKGVRNSGPEEYSLDHYPGAPKTSMPSSKAKPKGFRKIFESSVRRQELEASVADSIAVTPLLF